LALAACVVLIVIGCSSITVKQDYDKEANFTALKTFDWMQAPATAVTMVGARPAASTSINIRKER
jgi:hypothetical protein